MARILKLPSVVDRIPVVNELHGTILEAMKAQNQITTETDEPTDKSPAPSTAPTSTSLATGEDKSRHLQIVEEPGKSRERMITDVIAQGLASNAWTAMRYMKPEFGDISLTDMVASLRESGHAINRNDMAAAEGMLYAQAVALNAMFGEMARVASCNVFKSPEWADRYMRLALKAQSQSRMTVETLAAMKNPPVVFTKQANFAAGHQQVNNGAAASAPDASHASETKPAPSKILEAPCRTVGHPSAGRDKRSSSRLGAHGKGRPVQGAPTVRRS